LNEAYIPYHSVQKAFSKFKKKSSKSSETVGSKYSEYVAVQYILQLLWKPRKIISVRSNVKKKKGAGKKKKRENSLFKLSGVQGECICLRKKHIYIEVGSYTAVYDNSAFSLNW